MPELNSTGTATRAWQAGDELVAVVEGGVADDALIRLSSLPQDFITGLLAALLDKADANHVHALATAMANGFMAAADKAKLDAILGTNTGDQTPGGADKHIQFNDGGAFGGVADFTWDKAAKRLALAGVDSTADLTGITTEPAAPAAGVLRLYTKSIAGRMVLKAKGPSGLDTPLQAALWGNNFALWTPTAATAGFWLGTTGSAAGTYLNLLPTDTKKSTGMKRSRYSNVVTTANQILGQRSSELMFFRGNGNPGSGGFFFFGRMTWETWTNGGRFFAGLCQNTTVVSTDPSTANHCVGFAIDAADNGAISFLTRGTSATKAPTGFTAASASGFDLYIFCAPGSSEYSWRIVDIDNGTEASGVATATLPTNTQKQFAAVLASNAALTPVDSIQLGVNRIYVETDY